MPNNRLKIIQSTTLDSPSKIPGGKSRRLEAQALFDRLWLLAPERMDPTRNCLERERLLRSMAILEQNTALQEKQVADLGCGAGVYTRQLRDKGAHVDAVDVSNNALKHLKEQDCHHITPLQDYVPLTKLEDDKYDIVICMDLIAYLEPNEYRLLFSELARIVKSDGHILVSTPIDIDSDDALQKFIALAETEITIEKWVVSYHRLYIQLKKFIGSPKKFVKANKDVEYKNNQLKIRAGFSKFWFRLNSSTMLTLFWLPISLILSPLYKFIAQSQTTLLTLEKICRLIWSDSGISHAIVLGKRIPLATMPPADEIPRERKHKKEVWE